MPEERHLLIVGHCRILLESHKSYGFTICEEVYLYMYTKKTLTWINGTEVMLKHRNKRHCSYHSNTNKL